MPQGCITHCSSWADPLRGEDVGPLGSADSRLGSWHVQTLPEASLLLCTLNRPFTLIDGSFNFLHNPKSIAKSGTEQSWASWRALNFSPTQTWHGVESSLTVFLQESFLDPLVLCSLSWQSALWTHLALTFHLLKNLCSNLNRSWSAHSRKEVFGGCSGEMNRLALPTASLQITLLIKSLFQLWKHGAFSGYYPACGKLNNLGLIA